MSAVGVVRLRAGGRPFSLGGQSANVTEQRPDRQHHEHRQQTPVGRLRLLHRAERYTPLLETVKVSECASARCYRPPPSIILPIAFIISPCT